MAALLFSRIFWALAFDGCGGRESWVVAASADLAGAFDHLVRSAERATFGEFVARRLVVRGRG